MCEIVCSLKHTGMVNPSLARVKVVHSPKAHAAFPLICHHCQNAPCQAACPIPGAMYTDEKTGAILIDEQNCVQCFACVEACPFGAIQVGPNKEVLKCDLCGGSPACAEYCPQVWVLYPGMPQPAQPCLQYIEPVKVTRTKLAVMEQCQDVRSA